MKIPGAFAIPGGLFLLIGIVMGHLRAPISDTETVLVPAAISVACFAIATVWGLAKGLSAVR
jgi:hypothetical protein